VALVTARARRLAGPPLQSPPLALWLAGEENEERDEDEMRNENGD
jgi:hypothetical protein